MNKHPRVQRWGGPAERERCLREAERYLQNADAEDAVQEALVRAWRKSDAWIPPEGPLPWLLTITRNEALRLVGRRKPTPSGSPLEIQVRDECMHRTIQEDLELDRAPVRMDLGHALAQLRAHDRVLLELHYRYDIAQADLASRLDIQEDAVKKRLERARKRLRAVLEGERTERDPVGARAAHAPRRVRGGEHLPPPRSPGYEDFDDSTPSSGRPAT